MTTTVDQPEPKFDLQEIKKALRFPSIDELCAMPLDIAMERIRREMVRQGLL